MKKILLLCLFIGFTFILVGCPDEETIDMNKFKINFSVYSLLPKEYQNDNQKQTTVYQKLTDGYHYIERLFTVYEEFIDDAIRNKEIEMKRNKWLDYNNTFVVNGYNEEHLSVSDLFNHRKLTLKRTDIKNDMPLYSGVHHASNGIFTFSYQDNKDIKIQFERDDSLEKSIAHIIRNDDGVKTLIHYEGGNEDYDLYAVTNGNYTAIYYSLNDGMDVKNFQIFNQNGNMVYQALNANQGKYQISGWIVDQEIDKISDHQFIVNNKTYTNLPNQPHLIEVKKDYFNKNSEKVYMLGRNIFSSQFVPLIDITEPFNISDIDMIKQLAQNTYAHYQTTKDIVK